MYGAQLSTAQIGSVCGYTMNDCKVHGANSNFICFTNNEGKFEKRCKACEEEHQVYEESLD